MNGRLVSSLGGVVFLAACSTAPRQSPAPVIRSLPEPPAQTRAEPGRPQVSPLSPIEQQEAEQLVPPPAPPRSGNKAVRTLLASAERQASGGETGAAVSTVERALRIEPRNAHLWHRLANLRMQQKRYGLAVELAAKSNSLAAGDTTLKRRNWALIAKSNRIRGDRAGAQRAEQMLRRLER